MRVVLRDVLAAAVGLVLLSLQACSGGNPAPGPLPRATVVAPTLMPSDASSASPSSAQPEAPTDFLARWVEAQNEGERTGDMRAFRRLGKGCTFCDDFSKLVEKIYAAGGTIETDGWAVVRMEKPVRIDPGVYQIFFYVDSAPTLLKESRGARVKRLSGAKNQKCYSRMQRFGDDWRMTNVSFVS